VTARIAAYRVAIAKDGTVFWRSQWVDRASAERIRRKNQKLIDAHRWAHTITIEDH
jgi:hypothetical protein